jgi:hypothetical protein
MNTTTITHLCSATQVYTETLSAFSAVNIFPPNISMIWNEVSATTMGLAAPSAFSNITLIATMMAPYVSALPSDGELGIG